MTQQYVGLEGSPVARVVLDTNILVASAYAPDSASRHIVEACLRREMIAVASPALRQEYEYILKQAVRTDDYKEPLRHFVDGARQVDPARTPRVVPDDPADDKLVAVALAAGCDAIITNDRHLLALDPIDSVRVLRPVEFLRWWRARGE